MKNNTSVSKIFAVLSGFFVMGFVDVVGISTNYVKLDFGLSDSMANLLPMMVFLWFAIFSLPTGILMNKIGRKITVLIGMLLTLFAMLIPVVIYTYLIMLISFALLGIGNTILQVSLNPLMANIVDGKKLTSSLTMGQFIKAISSFLGPIIAGFAVMNLGNWQYVFPVFAFVTVISGLWLLFTQIKENEIVKKSSSFKSCLVLLSDKKIFLCFLGILAAVGIDVGLNTTIPKLLIERCGIQLKEAGLGTSLYFAARTIGTFTGAVILSKISPARFFTVTMVLAIIAMSAMITLSGLMILSVLIFITGLMVANVFSIIFSSALQSKPDHTNEISGLMIMGVAGGAVLPPVMGIVSDSAGQTGALLVLIGALIYLLFCSVKIHR